MQRSGFRPDVVTYTALISAFERGGEWLRALEAFRLVSAQCYAQRDAMLWMPAKGGGTSGLVAFEANGTGGVLVAFYECVESQRSYKSERLGANSLRWEV